LNYLGCDPEIVGGKQEILPLINLKKCVDLRN